MPASCAAVNEATLTMRFAPRRRASRETTKALFTLRAIISSKVSTEPCHVEAVGTVAIREKLQLVLARSEGRRPPITKQLRNRCRRESRMRREKGRPDVLVLRAVHGACRVDEQAAGPHQIRVPRQDLALARRKGLHLLRSQAPARVRVAAQRAETAARR